MDLNLSEDQRLLQESVRRLLADTYSPAGRRQIMALPQGFSRAAWNKYAELGLLALPLPQQFSGLSGTSADIGLVMEEFGRSLVAEPYLSTVLLGAGLVAQIGTDEQRLAILPGVASGDVLLSAALTERGSRFDPGSVATTAKQIGTGWLLQGAKIMALGAPSADHFIVSARLGAGPVALFLVPAGADGLRLTNFPMIDGRHAGNLELRDVRLERDSRLGNDGDVGADIEAVVDRATVGYCAFAVGAAHALLEMTIDYLNSRVQFGKPLASNQVLRHRLADMALQCEQATSITLRAASMLNGESTALVTSAAKSKVGRCVRFIAEQAVQLHGGMGVTEELDVGLYFKSLLAFELLFGTVDFHRRRYASLRRVPKRRTIVMEVSHSEAEGEFRREVRSFIAKNLPSAIRRASRLTASVFSDPEVVRPWHRALHAQGWVAPDWPRELGGAGWTAAQRRIFEEECAGAYAPPISPMGIRMVGPVIMRFGTQEQRDYYLPRILSGEDYWCQGYSEPGAGSDLASLKTRAVSVGNDYIVNGTKIWTSHAHYANRMFALVRTGEGARKQDGISFLLIDMRSPGLSVRPILTIGGDHEVNQVFFDDVRVPQSNRVGEEGAGWSYGKYLLEFERGGGSVVARMRQMLADTAALAESCAGYDGGLLNDAFSDRFADLEIDVDAFEMLELRASSIIRSGGSPGIHASYIKALYSQLRQQIQRLAVDVLGERGLVWETQRPLYELDHVPVIAERELGVMPAYLNGRAATIYGGSLEIQHEIIAKALLDRR